MKLFGGYHHLATRYPRPGAHLAPKEKSAYGQIRCRTLYSALGLIFLSCALFVGTTFAWFTDRSTGATAQIMGGTLSVELVFDETDSEGLSFDNIPMTRTEPGDSPVDVWSPGEVFETPLMHVVNSGDLPIAYKLVLDPADELKDAVTFEIVKTVNGVDTPISETEIFQLPAPADTEPAYFKIVGTVAADPDVDFSGQPFAKPFRLIVLTLQSGVTGEAEWPTYCTDTDHKDLLDPEGAPDVSGIVVSHNPEKPCRLIYTCATCGEVLDEDLVKVHINRATELVARYAVDTVIDKGDLTLSGDNTYTKTVICPDCNETIGTLTVKTDGAAEDERISTVAFDFKDPSIEDLSK